ncbi:MAG: choice-of-anchor J domain-containing protein [Muribaculaceae bacterium]|nr:choice-of-anchor J domain-containing protein [Muribaculaceae bacterium]
MKKILLSVAVATMTISASAYTLDTPVFFEENFVEMAKDSHWPSEDWITLGNGAKPSGLAAEIFNMDGSGPYYTIYDVGTQSIICANTDFEGGAIADQWLISPEIEVPYDVTSLYFNAYAYTAKNALGSPNASRQHTFKVMVSEGGTDRSDFTEIFSNYVTGKADSENFDKTEKVCSINGYQGKKVRIAFVVDGQSQGFTGFSNLRWGQYILSMDANLTSELAYVNDPVTIDYNVKMKAPITCPNMLVDLYINDEKITEATYKKAFGVANSYVPVAQRIQFKNVYTPKTDTPLNYKIVITPDFEGAVSSTIEGAFGFPKVLYKNNVVIEEMTGTQCGWCPRGIAALDYYHATYPGTETQGKVINIGIHNSTFGDDPMARGNERYTVSVAEVNGTANMPGCTMNRSTRGLDPTAATKVAELLALTSHNEAKIISVEMPEGQDGYDLKGQKAKVVYEVKNGYDAAMRNLNAAVVVVENDVKGTNRGYNQSNYLATNYTDGISAYNAFRQMGAVEGMVPYLNTFSASGNLGNETISFSKITYQHVSRGIFPSFEGVTLPTVWKSDEAQKFSMEFDIPETILNIKNTEIVLLIINNQDRTIVASDSFSAAGYSTPNAVESIVTDNNVAILKNGASLEVNVSEDSFVEVYALDGTKLAAYQTQNGQLVAPAPASGLLLVKVSNASGVKTAKLLF